MEYASFPDRFHQSMKDTLEEIKMHDGKSNGLCILEIDGQMVGELSYSIQKDEAYPGWKICNPKFQNRGYGPKIIKMFFDFLFTQKQFHFPIQRIVWDTMLENRRAQYVYETKIGAIRTGVTEKVWQDQRGRWRTAVNYEIRREAFYQKNKNKS